MNTTEKEAAARGMTVSEYLIEMRECQMAEQRMEIMRQVHPKMMTRSTNRFRVRIISGGLSRT